MRFVVVEGRGSPTLHRVAVRAMSLAILGRKLTVVCVGVTRFTLLRSAFVSRFGHSCGFMTLRAGYGSVGAQQRELRFCMVEAADICPTFDGVASLAAQQSAVGSLPQHICLEFALVRIVVASGATAIFEAEWQNFVGVSGQPNFVAP